MKRGVRGVIHRPEQKYETVMPFLLRFLERTLPSISGDETLSETSTETSTDGKIDDDTADDTDVGDLEPQTGVIADSGTREDEE